MNIFSSVWELFKNNHSLNEKPFAGSLQKMSRTCISGKLNEKNCLNYYKLILIIQCNINFWNSIRFVCNSFNGENALHRKTLRRLFTKNVVHSYFPIIMWKILVFTTIKQYILFSFFKFVEYLYIRLRIFQI